jgi:outer membrane protein OmpA-like peptidoglycan-associated protein
MKKAVVSFILLIAFTFSYSQTFTLNDTTFKAGSFYRSYQVFFELAKTLLRSECYPCLDSVVTFLNNNPKINLEIDVHSDSRGPDTHLTMNRAMSIRDYLVSKGIDTNRLKAVGYGKVKPVISDTAIGKLKTKEEKEAAYQKNRRVEFKIIAI